MSKSTHFIGQPLYIQLLNYFNRDEILSLSQAQGGEHYIKKFDAWHHLVVMLYVVMMRLDSLREIKTYLFDNVNRFNYLGNPNSYPIKQAIALNYLYINHYFIYQKQSKKHLSYRLCNSLVIKKLQIRFSKDA